MNLFAYRHGSGLFHTLDVRFKCILVCLVSVSVLNITLAGNLILLSTLIWLLKKEGFSISQILRHSFFFLIFLAVICLSRWLTTPGDIMVQAFGITLTRQGLLAGLLAALRFFSILLTGVMFTSTTSTLDIRNAVQWFLKPVPFVPEKQAALMIGLSLRFLPLILKQANEVSYAVDARCGNLRKNPVKRIINLAWPLLKKVFKNAQDLTFAMEARCYSENRTAPVFNKNGNELRVIAAALFLFAGLMLLGETPLSF